jgi:hypothetical protein
LPLDGDPDHHVAIRWRYWHHLNAANGDQCWLSMAPMTNTIGAIGDGVYGTNGAIGLHRPWHNLWKPFAPMVRGAMSNSIWHFCPLTLTMHWWFGLHCFWIHNFDRISVLMYSEIIFIFVV